MANIATATQKLSLEDQIKAQKAALKALQDQMPKVDPKPHILERRALNDLSNEELLKFPKVVKVVRGLLKNVNEETFMHTLSETQKKKVVIGRYQNLVKSPSLVVKMFSPTTYEKFVDESKYSAAAYMNTIRSAMILSEATYQKRRQSKKHYSLDK